MNFQLTNSINFNWQLSENSRITSLLNQIIYSLEVYNMTKNFTWLKLFKSRIRLNNFPSWTVKLNQVCKIMLLSIFMVNFGVKRLRKKLEFEIINFHLYAVFKFYFFSGKSKVHASIIRSSNDTNWIESSNVWIIIPLILL